MDTHEQQQRRLVSRLRRVEGQIRGVQGMIEKGSTCEQVAQQLAAARRALDRAFYDMIACSMEMELEKAPDAAAVRAAGAHISQLLARYG
jgi:DNA-binding FrmR family transcriptional regulator